ncbi:Aldehyde dehydrogenase family 2 member C4 [Platanthera guangdongensis]|uniref:Aldehyde dehydrogenase family 2 member C4 n=1 Tax=Platanthera guangdongensis TaxID=2320717 RepID=A0ABR2LIK7_9ASPA
MVVLVFPPLTLLFLIWTGRIYSEKETDPVTPFLSVFCVPSSIGRQLSRCCESQPGADSKPAYINNALFLTGKTFETIDPRNGEVIIRMTEGDKDDIDLAVKAARKAFDHGAWPRMSGNNINKLTEIFERGKIMIKYAELIEDHINELAALDSLNGGKLLSSVKAGEIPGGANLLRYYAGAADKIHGDTLKLAGEFHGYTLKEPIGVVGHIVPWNFPTPLFFFKVSPALAAGCTMVVKPAEQTPLSALYHAHLAKLVTVLH